MEHAKQPYFFGQRGTILRGEHPGWLVEILDDTADTGGYYVLVHHPNPKPDDWPTYNWWFEDRAEIPIFIEDMQWEIAWPAAELT